tara:strand:+ start:2815 stop:4320 length:1506 start_codon:yes stop_codon:yes gene_type:complete
MRFFEVDSAVDAIMSAAMLAQTKAGSRNQQGQLSMNGFLQMLKNAGIVMDYEGFKTVYDTNPQLANVIEKFDKDTVTFMSADGNDKAVDNTKASNQPSPDERITQMARSAVRTREFKESIVNEEGFSDDMIEKLRAAYEPLKGKKIPPNPLMNIFDKIDYNVKGLIQLYKADIPFVSMMAMSRLMLKHDYKADDINKLGSIRREEVEGIDESGILYKAGVKKYTKPGMQKIQSAAGKGASAEEIGRIKDKYNKKKKVNADINEASPANNLLVQIDNMHSKLKQAVLMIPTIDDGDLTDQVTTMMKHLNGLEAVIKRSFAIIPESIEEAIPTSEFGYDIKKFFAKVQELEDENQHGEVAKMVTQLYGTGPELMIINGINAMHSNEGSIGPEAQKLRDKISTKYYYQAEKDANRRNPADSDGPDEEQRDRTRAANTDEGFASDAQRKAAFASGYKPTGKKKKTETKTKNIDFGRMISGKGPKPKDVKTESMQSKFRKFLKGKK